MLRLLCRIIAYEVDSRTRSVFGGDDFAVVLDAQIPANGDVGSIIAAPQSLVTVLLHHVVPKFVVHYCGSAVARDSVAASRRAEIRRSFSRLRG
jgi:hypothetical protein